MAFAGRLRRRYGLNVLVAEGEHQDNVHNALYAELARGTVQPATRARFRAAITDLVARGAEVIVLAASLLRPTHVGPRKGPADWRSR